MNPKQKKKRQQMQQLPKNSPRVKAAQNRLYGNPSAGSLAEAQKRKRTQGHFRWKTQ